MFDVCLVIWFLIVSVFTAPVWFPILILTSPIWLSSLLGFYVFLRVTGLWYWVKRALNDVYEWLFYRSQTPRRYLWRKFYNGLAWLFPQAEWKCMNYGYAATTESGHIIRLEAEDEPERFSYQLYHIVATGIKHKTSLAELDVLEVGSGRGGGLSYILRYLNPASATGVDFSQTQVDFCKRNYNFENLRFVAGDAENLPIESAKMDVVINVESSHCYGNMSRFVSEVDRVLRPEGMFLFTDFRATKDVPELEKALTSASLVISEKKDITDHVLRALSLDSKRRLDLIQSRTPRCKK
jgi:SAM-dependent methyltransferase